MRLPRSWKRVSATSFRAKDGHYSIRLKEGSSYQVTVTDHEAGGRVIINESYGTKDKALRAIEALMSFYPARV
jgi:hypothetical protein